MAGAKKVKRDVSSLRSTIKWLLSEGDVVETSKVVNPDLEITALQKKLDGGLGLLFRNVKGYDHIQAITNMYANRNVINKMFGWKDETDRTIQLAKAREAHVWAMTSPAKSDALRQLGADETISRETELTTTPGANSLDVVVDLVAGEKWPQYLEVLRPGGRYAVAGAIAGPHVTLDVRTLYLKDISLFGCTILEPEVFENLIKRIEQGAVKPVVFQSFALAEIGDAQNLFLKKQHVGKIVLKI